MPEQPETCGVVHLNTTPHCNRRSQRVKVKFAVHMETDDDLFEVHSLDVSEGGAFFYTPRGPERDTEVSLFFIHPVDESEVLIQGTVVRHGDGPSGLPGVGVAFDEPSRARISRLMDFVESACINIAPADLERVTSVAA